MKSTRDALLTDLLKAVSRSFYLTLRVLPAAVRPQIGLAYLLARATDTIADSELIPVSERLAALADLRNRILGSRRERVDFQRIVEAQPEIPGGGSNAERVLVQRAEAAVALLEQMSPADADLIRKVLSIISSGQQLDLERFGDVGELNIRALQLPDELDDYTYRVAGCVGEFWTKMCRRHLFPGARIDDEMLVAQGIRFGKGLQLVNILRDLPRDLRQGRCYLPGESLSNLGLAPSDLLNPAAEPRLRPLYNAWLEVAHGHLRAGWDYTNALPRSCVRVRLACAWPILIGARTLTRLRHGNVLDPAQRIKVSRREVRKIMLQTVWRYPFRRGWERMFLQNFGEAR